MSNSGFEKQADGPLYVPAELAKPRSVMSNDDRKMLIRALAMLDANYQIEVTMKCLNQDCDQRQIVMTRGEGGVTLTCGHRQVYVPDVNPVVMSAKTRRRRGL